MTFGIEPKKLMLIAIQSYTINNRSFIKPAWWFQTFFIFTPKNWGKMNPIWRGNIFQLGWFNHQPDDHVCWTDISTHRFWGFRKFPWIEAKALAVWRSYAVDLRDSGFIRLLEWHKISVDVCNTWKPKQTTIYKWMAINWMMNPLITLKMVVSPSIHL